MAWSKKVLLAVTGLSCALVFTFNVVQIGNATSNGNKESELNFSKTNLIEQYKSIEKTELGIEKYKKLITEKNNEIKNKKVEDINTTITFSRPLELKELKEFVKKHSINPQQFVARAVKGNERITLAFKPHVDEKHVNMVKKQLKEEYNAEFVGFIDMYGFVDHEDLTAIENDEVTFLADTTGDKYFLKYEKDNGFAHALSWLLEDVKKEKEGKNK